MFESFYTYLHGPRTFWGNSGTIINNNFFGPPMLPPRPRYCGMSMFSFPMAQPQMFGGWGGNCCDCNNGMNTLFGFMFLNQMLNNTANSIKNTISSGGGGGRAKQKKDTDNSDKINNLENELATTKKQLEDLKKAKAEKQDLKDNVSNTETGKSKKDEKASTAQDGANNDQQNQETLDDKLNKIDGYKGLTPDQQNYVKDKIKSQQTDENGNTTYNISAIAHSGDTLNKIINRFYKAEENHDSANIPQTDYKTKTTGQSAKYPSVGEEISLNGTSDFALHALIQDAKDGITKDGEIAKTNAEMTNILNKFKNGNEKLSKEYVLQNHMMTETKYNKVIQEKYSK